MLCPHYTTKIDNVYTTKVLYKTAKNNENKRIKKKNKNYTRKI